MAMKDVWQRMTLLDRFLVGLLICAAVLAQIWLGSRPVGATVVVERDGRIVFQAPLDTPRQIAVDGPLGSTEILIEQGLVRIIASPCPHKVCMGMGAIKRTGQVIACVPNHLLIRIDGPPEETTAEHAYDLLSR